MVLEEDSALVIPRHEVSIHARFAACILGNHVKSVVLDYIDMRGDYIAHVVYSVIVEVDVYIRIV